MTKTIKKKATNYSFIISLVLSLIAHILILIYLRNHATNELNASYSPDPKNLFRLDQINFFRPKVGVNNGSNKANNPDFVTKHRQILPSSTQSLNFENLAPNLNELHSTETKVNNEKENEKEKQILDLSSKNSQFFNYKQDKVIRANREHDLMKVETIKNLGINRVNSKASSFSNFDIRIERPNGVSEDQLNADEKTFYSFYKRSYSNYISKLFSTYNKVRVERPGLDRDLDDSHLLVGKIDYDENGDIIKIQILKSSKSDNVHYFFEEVLKDLEIKNPPKIIVKDKKEFSVYYQIYIN